MTCVRHPKAAAHGAHCAACLFEDALVAGQEVVLAPVAPFTILVPLGETFSASVLLVRTEPPSRQLFRLKTWHIPAPVGFLDRVQELRAQLTNWSEPSIAVPCAAWVNADGRPCVLSEFRQGVLLLDRVKSGRLSQEIAGALLGQLRNVTRAAHRRGLGHGSIVPGNVLVGISDNSGHLLDFGLTAVLTTSTSQPSEAADEAGFVALHQALQALGGGDSDSLL